MIALILGLSFGEVMWGERTQKTCWNIQSGHKKQLDLAQCDGVDQYYFKNAQGWVLPRPLPKAKVEFKKTGVGYTWKDCENKRRVTFPFDEEGNFKPQCAPDTLYSWQFCSTVEELRKRSTPDNVFPIDQLKGYLYSWRTPLGSVAYNGTECSLRIKLKKDAKFTRVIDGFRECTAHPDAQIIDNNFGTGQEFIICDGSVVESWSFGTQEHLEEIMYEDQWIQHQPHSEYDHFYSGRHGCWLKEQGDAVRKALKNVTRVLNHSPDKTGYVFFAGGKGQREDHFRTKTPGYFNPRGGP